MRKMLKEKCGRQNRIRRFNGMTIPRRSFGEILRQAMAHDSVDGKILYSDSTHLGANTNEDKFRKEEVKKESQDFLFLDQAKNIGERPNRTENSGFDLLFAIRYICAPPVFWLDNFFLQC